MKTKTHFFRSNAFTLSVYKIIRNTNKKLEGKKRGGKFWKNPTKKFWKFHFPPPPFCRNFATVVFFFSKLLPTFHFFSFLYNSWITLIIMLWNDGKWIFLWEWYDFFFHRTSHKKMSHWWRQTDRPSKLQKFLHL